MPDIQSELYACIADRCRALKAQPLEIGGIADHVHVLARIPATIPIAQVVHDMKGASSHLMNHILRPGSNFRWQGTYSAFSVSPEDVARVRTYIRHQAEHHANDTLENAWESTSE
jgi:REP element-mobilizing transposase RayT